ncbi:aminotransferase class I/II-fold pyridoxal phosphate-dependent enzyme [Sporosarcina sp. CAU 1771]
MNSPNRPVVEALENFKEAAPVSFHVPGHKNGLLSNLPEGLRSALQYDVTELEGLDDLHEPTGVLLEAQNQLSNFYGADQSFFLVNGSTVGNLAMIYATCGPGDTVIIQRNAHKSIFNAIELTGSIPVFVSPQWEEKTKTFGTLSAVQVGKALEMYPEAKAVILTYPTYYGETGIDLKDIIQLCHVQEIPVLVDEAHGAHFVVGEPFPHSALELGADVVVHSAHKTLPAMTMASFLHVKSTLIDPKKIAHYLRMLQSSSPSYLLMASLDDARAYVESYTQEDKMKFMKNRKFFIDKLKEIDRLQLVEVEDPLKLIVRAEGFSGFYLQEKLEAVGIYSELADSDQVLFVLPLLKEEHDYPFLKITENIKRAFSRLDITMKSSIDIESMHEESISVLEYTATELRQMKTKWTPYEAAVDEIAGASIIPYPPGIPLVLGGEKVTTEHVQSLSRLIHAGARFQGAICLDEKKILVVNREMEE